jgi:hypothetical protein
MAKRTAVENVSTNNLMTHLCQFWLKGKGAEGARLADLDSIILYNKYDLIALLLIVS